MAEGNSADVCAGGSCPVCQLPARASNSAHPPSESGLLPILASILPHEIGWREYNFCLCNCWLSFPYAYLQLYFIVTLQIPASADLFLQVAFISPGSPPAFWQFFWHKFYALYLRAFLLITILLNLQWWAASFYSAKVQIKRKREDQQQPFSPHWGKVRDHCISGITRFTGAEGVAQLVESLPSMHEITNGAWWLTSVISALEKYKQEYQKFNIIFAYIWSSRLGWDTQDPASNKQINKQT